MGAVFILYYGNPVHYDGPGNSEGTSGTPSAAYRSAYVNFAAAAASHFVGRNVVLEVWNEPNIQGFWKPAPDPVAYGLLASASLAAMKAVAPGLAVAVGATSHVDVAFLDQALAQGDFSGLDLVTVHPYRASRPETFYEDFRAAVEVAAQRTGNPAIHVASGEWGYTATGFGGDGHDPDNLESQARYAIRELLYGLLRNLPRIVWYDVRNDGQDPANPEHNFGLLWNDGTHKPAYEAVATFANLRPSGACTVRRVDTGLSHVYALLFEGQAGPPLLAVWESRPATTSTLVLPACGNLQAFDLYGAPLAMVCSSGVCRLNLSGEDGPVYFQPSGDGCLPGETRACGSCGTQTCNADCTWSACEEGGACHPGASETEPCGDCGSRTRTCGEDCTWGQWSACEGPDPGNGSETCDTGLLGICSTGVQRCIQGLLECQPEQDARPEVCNGLDDDCDGQTDEEGVCGEDGGPSGEPGPDGGSMDGGSSSEGSRSGCGCAVSGNGGRGASWLLLLAVLVFLASRMGRPGARARRSERHGELGHLLSQPSWRPNGRWHPGADKSWPMFFRIDH